MTRTFLVIVCLAAVLAPAAFASSNGAVTHGPVSLSDLAPADEYFGRGRLSPIAIRHKVFALKDDLHHARMMPDAVLHDAGVVQDALLDWAGRFPRDSWLPAAAWNLATLYEELPGPDAQKQAVGMLGMVRDRFASSPFGDYAVHDLARGVGIRPWPRWALAAEANDGASLLASVLNLHTVRDVAQLGVSAEKLEERYWVLSKNGNDPSYARTAWELASTYERLPGPDARTRAIRLLALLLDRYPSQIYGTWALRDLERGVGQR